MKERRAAERVHVALPVRWEGVLTAMKGTVGDLSVSGCFVLSEDKVEEGELIRLEIVLPNRDTIYLWGQIVYKMAEIGFGLSFTAVDDESMKKLELLLKAELYRKRRKPAGPAGSSLAPDGEAR